MRRARCQSRSQQKLARRRRRAPLAAATAANASDRRSKLRSRRGRRVHAPPSGSLNSTRNRGRKNRHRRCTNSHFVDPLSCTKNTLSSLRIVSAAYPCLRQPYGGERSRTKKASGTRFVINKHVSPFVREADIFVCAEGMGSSSTLSAKCCRCFFSEFRYITAFDETALTCRERTRHCASISREHLFGPIGAYAGDDTAPLNRI